MDKEGKKAGKVVRAASPLQPRRVFRGAAAAPLYCPPWGAATRSIGHCAPPAFPAGPFRGPDAKQPLKLHPSFTCAAWPDRTLPRDALLRADAADGRGALGTPPATRARGATVLPPGELPGTLASDARAGGHRWATRGCTKGISRGGCSRGNGAKMAFVLPFRLCLTAAQSSSPAAPIGRTVRR